VQFLVGRAGPSFPLRRYATIARLDNLIFLLEEGPESFEYVHFRFARFCSEEWVWYGVFILCKAAEAAISRVKRVSQKNTYLQYLRKQPNVDIPRFSPPTLMYRSE